MGPNTSESRVAFSEALRAFQAGDIGHAELFAQLEQQLTAGASSAELLEILRRREYIQALDDHVHEAILSRLKPGLPVPEAETRLSTPIPLTDLHAGTPPGAAEPILVGDADSATPLNVAPSELLTPIERGEQLPGLSDFLDEGVAPRPRSGWPARIAGVSLAFLAVIGGWFLMKPHTKIATSPVSRRTVTASAPPIAPVVPQQPLIPKAGTVFLDCPDCPEMIVLPTGRFKQGSSVVDAAALEKPQHVVAIAYPLAMAINDVRVSDFRAFISATGRQMQGCDTYDGAWRHLRKAGWARPGFAQDESYPVTCASWNDAVAYAQWISATSGHRYRLPSASEWEYAARSGGSAQAWDRSDSSVCASADVADQSAARRYPGWDTFACDDGYINTAPVGTFKANAFGLNDMLGNVFQWTEDCWHDDYAGAPIDGSARTEVGCTEHEVRGGSWFTSPQFVSVSYRNHFSANYRTSSVGFDS